ncbi:MAG TPA: hypothetical protein VFE02_07425 [Candidatus Acidoferrales bacterium]|jgi:hypothetical protein|nr:hypothetical protein [Candidatus Acidoferrales bacterium]
MKFFYIAFAVCIFCTPAAAQEKKDGAPQPATSVLVNGQPIRGKVLEIDGKHFVAVEDLAQSLRGTIAYGEGQILLTFSKLPGPGLSPSSQSSSAMAPAPIAPAPTITARPLETGGVKGTLTYFFDFHTGNRPDAGAKIWLVQGRAEIPADQNFVAGNTSVGTAANPEQYRAVKYSSADEKGNFEMLDVPAGQYTLILQSAHTKWTLNDKRDIFGRGNGHNARDSSGRVIFLSVTVKQGEVAEASKDFGPGIDK